VSAVHAHGARIIWELKGDSVLVSAAFDDGMPMDSAQVTVFSGAEPSVPWLQGFTDERGEFGFVPDSEEALNWDVQVRKAGHGDIVHLSLDPASTSVSGDSGFTTLQIVLMSVCVVWGFIGTALFFSSRRKHG
jgi:nickel transport protein